MTPEAQKTVYTCPTCDSDFYDKNVCRNHQKHCDGKQENTTEKPEKPESVKKPDSIDSIDTESVKKLPVSREYNFNDYIPSIDHQYKESGKEKTKIMTELENRENSGQKPRYLISGDTGAGKTHLCRAIAAERQAPMFTIQGKYSLDEGDLLGSPVLVNGKTIWTDGTLTKALLASQEQEVVLLIDELNRARPESKGVLFSALDDRCQVELDARAGETIQGNPENLIVIGTMNEGTDYTVQELDKAEKRRFGRKFEVQHLGINYPEKEAEIVRERTPASKELSRSLVEVVNVIREKAESDTSVVSTGVPTSSLIDWSRTAYAYNEAGLNNAIVEAAEDTVGKPVYDNKLEREEVIETIKDYLDAAPYNSEEFSQWMKDPEQYDKSVCEHCGERFKSERGKKSHQTRSGCGQ